MKLGITFGAWDLLHAGHAHFLRECAEQCDALIVGLHTNPAVERLTKHPPVQTVFERYEQLNAIAGVDKIIPYDTEHDLISIIMMYHPAIRFLGDDYREDDNFTGKQLCERIGTKLVYLPRMHDYSSAELRNRVYNDVKRKTITSTTSN